MPADFPLAGADHLKSRTQAIAERGYDAEQVDREIAAERKREAALGLDFRRPGSPAQGPGSKAGQTGDNSQKPGTPDSEEADDSADAKSASKDDP